MRNALFPMALLVLASFMFSCTTQKPPLELETGDTVDVTTIVKGDEIEVKQAGKVARVRLLGIQAFAAVVDDSELRTLEMKSRDWAEDNLVDKQIQVVLGQVPKDRSGRYLAYIEKDGTDVNRKMIEEGRAVVYTEYPFSRERAYLDSETKARQAQAGVWATDSATALIRGLRGQWLALRKEPGYVDPLLETDGNIDVDVDAPNGE